MALLFWEGFDSYNNMVEISSRTTVSNVTILKDCTEWAAIEAGGGRFAGRCLRVFDSGYSGGQILFTNPVRELWTGKAIYIFSSSAAAFPTEGTTIGGGCVLNAYNMTGSLNFWNTECHLQVKANGAIYAYLGGTIRYQYFAQYAGGYNRQGLLGNTSPGAFSFDAWHYLETRYRQSTSNTSSDGIIEVWIDNNQVLNITGVNTRVTNAVTNVSSCMLAGTSGGYLTFDDVYVLDTNGSSPWNSRLGDIRIATVVPNTDVGANSGTPSTGTTHWGVIDERPLNTSDYLTIPNVANNTERFYISALPTVPGSIYGVAITSVQQKSDAGSCNTRTLLQSNTTGYIANSGVNTLTTSWTTYRDDYVLNPNTSSQWTVSEFANTQIGFEII